MKNHLTKNLALEKTEMYAQSGSLLIKTFPSENNITHIKISDAVVIT